MLKVWIKVVGNALISPLRSSPTHFLRENSGPGPAAEYSICPPLQHGMKKNCVNMSCTEPKTSREASEQTAGGEGNAILKSADPRYFWCLILSFCTPLAQGKRKSLDNNLHLVIGMQRSEKWITDQRAVTTVITWTAGIRRNLSWQRGKMGVELGGGLDRKVDKRLDLISSKCVTLAILIICTLHMYQAWKLGPWGDYRGREKKRS